MSQQGATFLVNVLTENYGKTYTKMAMEKVWPELKMENDKAIEIACDWFILNSVYLPSPAQLLAKVKEESAKIAMAEGRKMEEKAREEKRNSPDIFRTPIHDNIAKRSLKLMRGILGGIGNEMAAEGCRTLSVCYPGRGFGEVASHFERLARAENER
jgi:hypothetical protein